MPLEGLKQTIQVAVNKTNKAIVTFITQVVHQAAKSHLRLRKSVCNTLIKLLTSKIMPSWMLLLLSLSIMRVAATVRVFVPLRFFGMLLKMGKVSQLNLVGHKSELISLTAHF